MFITRPLLKFTSETIKEMIQEMLLRGVESKKVLKVYIYNILIMVIDLTVSPVIKPLRMSNYKILHALYLDFIRSIRDRNIKIL